jgi:hypothetical protein
MTDRTEHPTCVVAQDAKGGWLVLDEHGVVRGLFTTQSEAMVFACHDKANHPRAVVLSPERMKVAPAD